MMMLCTTFSSLASGQLVNGGSTGLLTVPTVEQVLKNGHAENYIIAESKETKVKPWVFADIKLNSVRTQNDKLNYSILALNRGIAHFQDQNKHLKTNDFLIILNTGFVINKDNYDNKIVYTEARKAFLDKELYQGDTLFTIAFLSGDNTVVRRSMWKLIDVINLGGGSSHSSTTNFEVGVTDVEEVGLSEAFGFKTSAKAGGSLGVSAKGISAELKGDISYELNETLSKTFFSANTITGKQSESVTVTHGDLYQSRLVLRYQLIDNFTVNLNTFNKITKELKDNMNMGGKDIIYIEPSSTLKGIDVPSKIIYDVIKEG